MVATATSVLAPGVFLAEAGWFEPLAATVAALALVSSQRLEILGCHVELAVNGPAAIERVDQTAFELIFMDCQMPGMDGYESTQKILAVRGETAPPIVALTANTAPRDREQCLAAGMKDFIAKPVHKADLARILKRWLRPEPARAK